MFFKKQWLTFCLPWVFLVGEFGFVMAASDEVTVAGVTIATMSYNSLKTNHDKYESVKYSHGKYVEGQDVFEQTEFQVREAKVAPDQLEAYVAHSLTFKSFTSNMSPEQESDFTSALLGAFYETQGVERTQQISLKGSDLRVVAVMMMITKKDRQGNIDILMCSLRETALTRVGLAWSEEWHGKIENQRMLEDWISYRLILHLQGKVEDKPCRSIMHLQVEEEEPEEEAPAAYRLYDPEEDEELDDVPSAYKQADPYFQQTINRVTDGVTFSGTVENIQIGKVSRERLYLIRYEDGDLEHLTRKEVKEGNQAAQNRCSRPPKK